MCSVALLYCYHRHPISFSIHLPHLIHSIFIFSILSYPISLTASTCVDQHRLPFDWYLQRCADILYFNYASPFVKIFHFLWQKVPRINSPKLITGAHSSSKYRISLVGSCSEWIFQRKRLDFHFLFLASFSYALYCRSDENTREIPN